MVLVDSNRISRAPSYSTNTVLLQWATQLLLIKIRLAILNIPGYHCLWPAFPNRSARLAIFYNLMQDIGRSCFLIWRLDKSRFQIRLFMMLQPSLDIRLPTYLPPYLASFQSVNRSWDKKRIGKNLKSLGYSSFARHYSRNHCLFSLPQGTKMFQFPRLPLPVLYIQTRVIRHDSNRVSPFGHLRFKVWLATPRSLSQPSTSFIGILRLGIHFVRLSNFLWKYNWFNSIALHLTSYW